MQKELGPHFDTTTFGSHARTLGCFETQTAAGKDFSRAFWVETVRGLDRFLDGGQGSLSQKCCLFSYPTGRSVWFQFHLPMEFIHASNNPGTGQGTTHIVPGSWGRACGSRSPKQLRLGSCISEACRSHRLMAEAGKRARGQESKKTDVQPTSG